MNKEQLLKKLEQDDAVLKMMEEFYLLDEEKQTILKNFIHELLFNYPPKTKYSQLLH